MCCAGHKKSEKWKIWMGIKTTMMTFNVEFTCFYHVCSTVCQYLAPQVQKVHFRVFFMGLLSSSFPGKTIKCCFRRRVISF